MVKTTVTVNPPVALPIAGSVLDQTVAYPVSGLSFALQTASNDAALPSGELTLDPMQAAQCADRTQVNHFVDGRHNLYRAIQGELFSTLNSLKGKIVANAAIVPAGENGTISVYVSGATDVVVDINGYLTPEQ